MPLALAEAVKNTNIVAAVEKKWALCRVGFLPAANMVRLRHMRLRVRSIPAAGQGLRHPNQTKNDRCLRHFTRACGDAYHLPILRQIPPRQGIALYRSGEDI